MPTPDDLGLPPAFDMPPTRLRHRRDHLATELRHAGHRAEPPAPRRGRRHRLALTLTGAACAAVAAVPAIDLLDSNGARGSVVEKAVAAVSSDDAVYHVVTLFTVRYETDDPRVHEAFDFEDVDMFEDVSRHSEAWIGPGNRNRTLTYEANGRDRGRLLQESSFDGSVGHLFDARANRLVVIRSTPRKRAIRPRRPTPPPAGVTVPPQLDPTADPTVQLRRLHHQGALRLDGTETVRGRRAYRLVSETFVDPSEKGHTERIEFLVDAETYLPLRQRQVSTQLGVSGLPEDVRPSPEMYETPVTSTATTEFLVYEKLPANRENLAKLERRPHPGATVFDPVAGRPARGARP